MGLLRKFFVLQDRKTAKILAVLILFYTMVFSSLCFWKYFQLGYDGLDLAIFNQVFFNTVHGDLFAFSIHPHSYLGDHAEFIILLLAPLYALWQSPLCLLLLQALVIALCAWPLFLIARKVLSPRWSLFIACLWLLNPFLHNMTLFEFHILPFAMFTVLWMFYFWQTERFKPFLLFLFLSLLIREDVALVVMFFGIMSWFLKRRQFKWSVLPFILGGAWFYFAMKIIGYFTPAGSYKFLVFYSWLGDNWLEILLNVCSRPLEILLSLATFDNLCLLTSLSLLFLGLNFFAFKYLIPTIPILAQLILGGRVNSMIALQNHYSSLLLVFWFISLIYAVNKIFFSGSTEKIFGLPRKLIKDFIVIVLCSSTIYFSFIFGPWPSFFKTIGAVDTRQTSLKWNLLEKIEANESVVASTDFLAPLSSRKKLYSLYYIYIGRKQFSQLPYELSPDTEKIIINFRESLDYWASRYRGQTSRNDYLNGIENWSDIFTIYGFKVVWLEDTFAVLLKQPAGIELFSLGSKNIIPEKNLSALIDDYVSLVGVSSWKEISLEKNFLPLSFIFQTKNGHAVDDYQFRLSLLDKDNNELYRKEYPLGYGFFPTKKWPKNSIIKINYNFWLPPTIISKNPLIICWEFFNGSGRMISDRFNSSDAVITDYLAINKRCLPLDKLP